MTEEQEAKLLELMRSDSVYQELLCQCRQLEPDFLRIRDDLSENDRDILDRYISVCENMEYCCTRLAYSICPKQ